MLGEQVCITSVEQYLANRKCSANLAVIPGIRLSQVQTSARETDATENGGPEEALSSLQVFTCF